MPWLAKTVFNPISSQERKKQNCSKERLKATMMTSTKGFSNFAIHLLNYMEFRMKQLSHKIELQSTFQRKMLHHANQSYFSLLRIYNFLKVHFIKTKEQTLIYCISELQETWSSGSYASQIEAQEAPRLWVREYIELQDKHNASSGSINVKVVTNLKCNLYFRRLHYGGT